jgi:hypothetical protein
VKQLLGFQSILRNRAEDDTLTPLIQRRLAHALGSMLTIALTPVACGSRDTPGGGTSTGASGAMSTPASAGSASDAASSGGTASAGTSGAISTGASVGSSSGDASSSGTAASGSLGGAGTSGGTGASGSSADTGADAGSGASGSVASDAGSCSVNFENALVRTCSSLADCTLVRHNDCCGTVVVGIRNGTGASFTAAEQAFQSCVPGCGLRGCFHADTAEDGKVPTSPGQAILAQCQSMRCGSTVR